MQDSTAQFPEFSKHLSKPGENLDLEARTLVCRLLCWIRHDGLLWRRDANGCQNVISELMANRRRRPKKSRSLIRLARKWIIQRDELDRTWFGRTKRVLPEAPSGGDGLVSWLIFCFCENQQQQKQQQSPLEFRLSWNPRKHAQSAAAAAAASQDCQRKAVARCSPSVVPLTATHAGMNNEFCAKSCCLVGMDVLAILLGFITHDWIYSRVTKYVGEWMKKWMFVCKNARWKRSRSPVETLW